MLKIKLKNGRLLMTQYPIRPNADGKLVIITGDYDDKTNTVNIITIAEIAYIAPEVD